MYLEVYKSNPSYNKIKTELTIKPYVPDDYFAKEYIIYSKVDDKYLIPLFFKLKDYLNTSIKFQLGLKCDINFVKSLRDYQVNAAELVYQHLVKNKSGLCCVYTGWGKTCLALWVACKLKTKTLIIVHTGALLEQWRERIEFFTDSKAGVYRQNCEDSDSNIVIGTVQSLLKRKYKTTDFGLLIIDETHMYPTEFFKNIFYEVPCLYTLGLTATLKRKDKLDKVINWFLGDVIVNIEQLAQQVSVRLEYYNNNQQDEILNKVGKLNQAKMLTDLCLDSDRTEYIISIIKECLSENRKILLLSHRRGHCEYLFKKLGEDISGLYLGGMNNDELEKTNAKRVILATYNMASMGYDNKTLDTLIFASPRSSIKQCVGRIIRQKNINHPLVIDIVDPYSFYNGLFNQRMRYYRSSKFIINNQQHNNLNELNEISEQLSKCLL